jgi:hypothetical protein
LIIGTPKPKTQFRPATDRRVERVRPVGDDNCSERESGQAQVIEALRNGVEPSLVFVVHLLHIPARSEGVCFVQE